MKAGPGSIDHNILWSVAENPGFYAPPHYMLWFEGALIMAAAQLWNLLCCAHVVTRDGEQVVSLNGGQYDSKDLCELAATRIREAFLGPNVVAVRHVCARSK